MNLLILAAAIANVINAPVTGVTFPDDYVWDSTVAMPRIEDDIQFDYKNPVISHRAALIGEGKFGGQCFRYAGAQRFTASDTPFSFYSDFTIECFFNFDQVTNSNQYILDYGSNGFTLRYYRAGAVNGIVLALGGSSVIIDSGFVPVPGTWHHVALVRQGALLKMYIDGVLRGQNTYNTNTSYTTYTLGNYGGGGSYSPYGRIDQFRVVMAAMYTENFTPPTEAFKIGGSEANYDPDYANVNLLVRDADNGTFTDTTGLNGSLIASGGAVADTVNKRVGTSSMSFPTDGSYFTVPWQAADHFGFGAADWTVECYVRPTRTVTGSQQLIGRRSRSGICGSFTLTLVNMKPTMYMSTNGSTWDGQLGNLSNSNLPLNRWSHIAVCRVGTLFHMFINGKLTGTLSWAPTLVANNIPLTIGASGDGTEPFVGNIDRPRITSGVGRYCSAFSPKRITDYANTDVAVPSPNDPHIGKVVAMMPFTAMIGAGADPIMVSTQRTGTALDDTRKLFGKSSLGMPTGVTGGVLYNNLTKALLYTNDWTVESWVNTSYNQSSLLPIIGQWIVTTSGAWALGVRNGKLAFVINGTGSVFGTSNIADSTWHHVAAVCRGGVVYLYVDGKLESSMAIIVKPSYNGNIQVGINPISDVPAGYQLNVSRIRVTNGKGRYIADFTPDKDTVQIAGMAA